MGSDNQTRVNPFNSKDRFLLTTNLSLRHLNPDMQEKMLKMVEMAAVHVIFKSIIWFVI